MTMTAETLARKFHETYEALAPDYGYRTRSASAVPWDQVPVWNKRLMIATAVVVLDWLREQALAAEDTQVDWPLRPADERTR